MKRHLVLGQDRPYVRRTFHQRRWGVRLRDSVEYVGPHTFAFDQRLHVLTQRKLDDIVFEVFHPRPLVYSGAALQRGATFQGPPSFASGKGGLMGSPSPSVKVVADSI